MIQTEIRTMEGGHYISGVYLEIEVLSNIKLLTHYTLNLN